MARHGAAMHGTARHGRARLGELRIRMRWGMTRYGLAGPAEAWLGKAR